MRAGDLFRRIDRRLLPLLVDAAVGVTQRPVRPRLLIGVAAVSVISVLVTAVWAAGHDGGAGIPTVDDVVQVGVAEGDSIPDYLLAAHDELATLSVRPTPPAPAGDSYALVTFSEYLPPGRLAPVLSGVSAEEMYLRVPLAQNQTQVIRMPAFGLPEDVLVGMDQVAQRKTREATDYRRRVAELGRAAELDLWKAYDEGARVATAEADAYRRYCACVFAAVVRGTPAALRELATQVEVRAVDPAPEVRRLDRAVFLPPLPEYDEVVPVGDAGLTSVGLPLSVDPDLTSTSTSQDPQTSGNPTPDSASPSGEPATDAVSDEVPADPPAADSRLSSVPSTAGESPSGVAAAPSASATPVPGPTVSATPAGGQDVDG
ncbi:hypothetical protein [Micromonospora sp. NBC_01813]|uniref:hypothetical protein n=1 Tax=Micromonospora sp. NBC_01813 TaxID=2975988 RepID=UPI002DD7AD58|nr:hypothetical protein [Micromonospora sp. NBC_01813]WSA09694.1 hypothetical protein OG958_02430 [Micromonospora sp. NBC_01813]